MDIQLNGEERTRSSAFGTWDLIYTRNGKMTEETGKWLSEGEAS